MFCGRMVLPADGHYGSEAEAAFQEYRCPLGYIGLDKQGPAEVHSTGIWAEIIGWGCSSV
jgi:hypothetical protein